jgi:hypothetical protein
VTASSILCFKSWLHDALPIHLLTVQLPHRIMSVNSGSSVIATYILKAEAELISRNLAVRTIRVITYITAQAM